MKIESGCAWTGKERRRRMTAVMRQMKAKRRNWMMWVELSRWWWRWQWLIIMRNQLWWCLWGWWGCIHMIGHYFGIQGNCLIKEPWFCQNIRSGIQQVPMNTTIKRQLSISMVLHSSLNFWQFWQFFENFWKFLTILTIFDNFDNFWQFWQFLTIFDNFDNFW